MNQLQLQRGDPSLSSGDVDVDVNVLLLEEIIKRKKKKKVEQKIYVLTIF